MGPASHSGIDHTPGEEDFTKNWIHQSQTSRTRFWTFKSLQTKVVFRTWKIIPKGFVQKD